MGNTCYGIDPGPFSSTVVGFDGNRVLSIEELPNNELVALWCAKLGCFVEDFVPYGSPVSDDSIRTIKCIGVAEHYGVIPVSRKAVKGHLCGTLKAGDKEIREALIERFGPGKEWAIGTKRSPGPLYGVSGHAWAALAVAVVAWDIRNETLVAETTR